MVLRQKPRQRRHRHPDTLGDAPGPVEPDHDVLDSQRPRRDAWEANHYQKSKNVVKIKSPEIWNRRHAKTAPSIEELFWDDVRTCGLRPFIAEEPHPRPRNSPSTPTSGLGPNADHGRTAWPTASKFLPRTLPLTLDLDLAPTTSSLAPFLNNPRSKNTVFHLRRIPSGQRSLSISDVDITSLGGEKEREYMYPGGYYRYCSP